MQDRSHTDNPPLPATLPVPPPLPAFSPASFPSSPHPIRTTMRTPSTTARARMERSDEDRYDYDRCTIMVMLQLRPAQEGQERQIVLSVQNGVGNAADFPLYRIVSETELGGPLPPAIADLLDQLRRDLPTRKKRSEAHQPSAISAPVSPPAPSRIQEVSAASPIPAPPTALPAAVPPRDELAMTALFEPLE